MKNNYIIFGLLIVHFLFDNFVIIPARIPFYNEIINPIIWIIICSIAIMLSKDYSLRVRGDKEKSQNMFIALIIYIIVYFLLGLVFGFQKTPYSRDLFSIIKNLWSFGGIIFFQEFIREALIKNGKKKIITFVLASILFSLINISYSNFESHFVDLQTLFTYSSSVLIPSIVESSVLTYLVYIGGAKYSIIYRLFMTVPQFIVPIIPNLDWFGKALVGIVVPLVIFVYMNYTHINKVERFTKREKRSYNPIVYVPVFGTIVLLAGFVMGLFKYQPIAVMSGSMSPTFNRGDAAIIEKLSKAEKDRLVVGDIIQFVSGTKFVIHRIHDITNDEYGNKLFITKGDHNNGIDVDKVKLDNVKGKVSFIVPFIGYPSVWLSGAL